MPRGPLARAAFVLGAALGWIGCAQIFGIDGPHEVPAPDNATSSGDGSTTAQDSGGKDSTVGPGGDSGADAPIEPGEDGSGANDANVDAMISVNGDAGTGAVGILGSACSPGGALACEGNAQNQALICNNAVWAPNGACPSNQLCDSRTGASQGTCTAIDPPCAKVRPGDNVCTNATTVVQCGPDLVSDSPVQTCTGQTCVAGACSGVCVSGATQCMGNGVQTCGSDGTWGTVAPCSNSTCAAGMCSGACSPGAVQCSGTSAVQACVAGMWGTPTTCTNKACVGGVCSGVCSPGTTECTSDTQVAMCSGSGQWAAATTCTNACVGTVDTVGTNCGGVCVPGTTECTSDTQVATCNTNGQWPAATTCTDACVGTIGVVGGTCGGVCVPTTTRCSGNAVETCDSMGQWGNAVACSMAAPTCTQGACVCPSGDGVSNGVCCPSGQTGCTSSCVNEQNDAHNCNGCGLTCPYGLCQAAVCAASFFGAGHPNAGTAPHLSIGAGTLLGDQVTSGASSTVVAIGVQTIEGGIHLRLGLYSDSGGKPSALLAQTGDLTSVAGGATEGNVTSTVAVSAGTPYWVMILSATAIHLATETPMVTWYYETGVTYGSLPTATSGLMSLSTNFGDLYFVTAP